MYNLGFGRVSGTATIRSCCMTLMDVIGAAGGAERCRTTTSESKVQRKVAKNEEIVVGLQKGL